MKHPVIYPILALSAATMLAAPRTHGADTPPAIAGKPNIILCMTDDQGWGDVSYNGLTAIKTPNIDAMAAAGLRFNRFYAQPSCSPTRASVMTGRHPNRIGVFWPGMKLRKEELTIAQAVKQAGYTTGHFGKWHLNGVAGPGKVIPDSDPLSPRNCGFDESFSVSNYFETDWTFGHNGVPEKTTGDGSDVIVDRALKFISDATAQKKPFLAVVWFGSPHSPYKPLADDLKAAAGSAYFAEMLGVDRSMGTLRAGLRKLGITDNTMVWYSSDNGGWIDPAEPNARGTNVDLRGRKGDVLEGGIRVPGLIEWPARIKHPMTTEMPAGTVDIFPTILDLLQIKPERPVPLDGISLLPLLDGKMTLRPQPLGFWQYAGGDHEEITSNSGPSAWNDNQYKLVKSAKNHWELYDLTIDRGEKYNLAGEHPDVFKRMKSELENWQQSVIRSYKGEDYKTPQAAAPASPATPPPTVPLLRGFSEVFHPQVDLRGGFWGPRLKTHHEVTIPHALDALEKDGHVTNFDKAAGTFDGELQGHPAFDSDLHKALEGALDSLQHFDDKNLRDRVDGILNRITAAQQKDGFLIAYYIVKDQEKRWEDLRLCHQMYNAGHFFEMAVEHANLTGQPKVLDSARRFADHIDGIFGPGKRYDVDGHQEVELALVKLYRATGERRYLDLARFFLDERGYAHGTERKPFDPKTAVLPEAPKVELTREQQREFWHAQLRTRNGRMQDHKPVIDQHEAVGHAVRAGYMYSAMTDVVRFMEAPGYEQALDDLWNDVVGRKMYLTGSIGTGQHDDEGFGDPYLLPNKSAYCETCAAIANILWQYRMGLLKGQAKYADVMELTLYNGMLSGIAISGDKFFYQNPLASDKGAVRKPWIGLSCCPTNIARIIPQIGGLAYAQGKNQLLVNLYMAGEAKLKLDNGTAVKISQQTDYPWNGRVGLTVTPGEASVFSLCLRIPGWALGHPVPSDLYRFASPQVPAVTLTINGKAQDAKPQADGYVHLQRRWQAGDVVELNLPMQVQQVHAHENVKDDNGRVALMRGPVVYCVEAADMADASPGALVLANDAGLHDKYRADLLGGVTVIEGKALADGKTPVPFMAIPYYAWQNRGKGAMSVWLRQPAAKP